MINKKDLVYWLDLTGPADCDEIIRLTIIDTNNNVLFNHEFGTELVGYWGSHINGIDPDDVITKPLFSHYKKEVQTTFNKASKIITFYGYPLTLQAQGITFPNVSVDDLSDDFRIMADEGNDTIENMCTYYGYPLTRDIMKRTGVDNAKAVNYCYHMMHYYRKVNND